MVNYLESKIYKIVGNGLTYYGSTCEPTLAKRLTKHRNSFKGYKSGKTSYVTSFKIIETGIFDIILVENFPCNSKDELHARERHYIENNECVNKNIPGRSIKEYKENHRDKLRECRKKKLNCSCGCDITIHHKARHMRSKKHQQYTMLNSFNKFGFSITYIMNTCNNISM